MSNIFLSYKYSGVPFEQLAMFINNIIALLRCDGKNNVVCNFEYLDYYEKNKMTTKQIMDHACKELLNDGTVYDYHILLVSETGFSEGATFEYGYGYAIPNIKKRLLISHKSINIGTCALMSDEIMQYDDEIDLREKLNNKFSSVDETNL